MTTVDDFAITARRYCDYAESSAVETSAYAEMQLVRTLLASLYFQALALPPVECDPVESLLTHEDYQQMFARFGRLPVGYYNTVFDPLQVDPVDCTLGDLADDLADVWRDVKEGLLLFEAGRRDAAGASWEESFEIHWGYHAVKALGVIHSWMGQNRYLVEDAASEHDEE